jgi:hypothetical protein
VWLSRSLDVKAEERAAQAEPIEVAA